MQVPSGPTVLFSTLSAGQTFWSSAPSLHIKTDNSTNNAVRLSDGALVAFNSGDSVTPQATKATAL